MKQNRFVKPAIAREVNKTTCESNKILFEQILLTREALGVTRKWKARLKTKLETKVVGARAFRRRCMNILKLQVVCGCHFLHRSIAGDDWSRPKNSSTTSCSGYETISCLECVIYSSSESV